MLGTIPRKQEGMLVIFLREQRGCQGPFLGNNGDVRDLSKETRGMLGTKGTRGVLGTFPKKEGGCQEPFQENKGGVRDPSKGTRDALVTFPREQGGCHRDLFQEEGKLGTFPREQGECQGPFQENKRDVWDQGNKGDVRNLF